MVIYYEPGRGGRYEAWQINRDLYLIYNKDNPNYPRIGVSRKYMALDEEATESKIHMLITVIFKVKTPYNMDT